MNHFWLIIKRMVGIPLAYYQESRVGIPLTYYQERRVGIPLTYYQERRVGIPLTGITPPHCCTCPKPWPGILTSHIVVFLCLVKSREVCFVDIGGIIDQHCLEVIVCFVDIGGTVDHHCLNIDFKIIAKYLTFYPMKCAANKWMYYEDAQLQ